MQFVILKVTELPCLQVMRLEEVREKEGYVRVSFLQ